MILTEHDIECIRAEWFVLNVFQDKDLVVACIREATNVPIEVLQGKPRYASEMYEVAFLARKLYRRYKGTSWDSDLPLLQAYDEWVKRYDGTNEFERLL